MLAADQERVMLVLVSGPLPSGCSSLARMKEACFAHTWPTTYAQLEVPIAQQRDVSGHSEVADLIGAEVDLSLARAAEEGEHTDMGLARMVNADKRIPEEQGSRMHLVVLLQGRDVPGLAASLVEGSDDASVLLGILEAVETGRLRRTSVGADA